MRPLTKSPAAGLPTDRLPQAVTVTARGDRTFRPDIQGLRAIAVVLVVLYHAGVPGLGGGYVGVDVFFVISGFLITRQLVAEYLRSGRISLSGFYARRIRRLLPSALTVIVATELVARFWGPPLQAPSVARDGIFSTFYLMNYRLAALGIDYQNAGGPVSPLQHFWSLAVEEQFYIFWPLVIIVLGILVRTMLIRTLAVVAAGAVVTSFVLSILVTGHDAALAYFALQTRAWELGIGALITLATPWLLRLPAVLTTVSGWSGLVLIVAAALLYTDATPFPGSAAALPVVGAALVIASGVTPRTAASGTRTAELLLGRSGMAFLGRMSYGWYLWHWPMIVLVPVVIGAAFGWPAKLGVSVLALGLAVVTQSVIEKPAARGRWGPRRWLVGGALMSASATVVAVLVLVLPQAGLNNTGPASALSLEGLDTAQLSALLDRAYVSPDIPSNLSPTLSAAVGDVPPTTANGCHAAFLEVAQPPCVFGDPVGRRTVVLFGDSHAEQWFGALDALAAAKGWKLVSWTKAACPLADVTFRSAQLQRPYTECPAWRTVTEQKIADLHPDLVIASGADPLPGPSYPNVTWSGRTVSTLSVLKRAAAQVVYLADTPLPGTDVPVCLAAHLRSPQQCTFTRESLTAGLTAQNQQPGRHAAVLAAARGLGVTVIDPTDWFCSAGGCPVIVENTLLYRDATHMTQSYSRILAPTMGRALAGVVPWMGT